MHKFKQGDKVEVQGSREGVVVGLSHLQYRVPGSPEYLWDVSVDGYEHPYRESSITLIPERTFKAGDLYVVEGIGSWKDGQAVRIVEVDTLTLNLRTAVNVPVSLDAFAEPVKGEPRIWVPIKNLREYTPDFREGEKYVVVGGGVLLNWVGTVVDSGSGTDYVALRFPYLDGETVVTLHKKYLEPFVEPVPKVEVEALREKRDELERKVGDLFRLETEIRRTVAPALERARELESERYGLHQELGRVEAELGEISDEEGSEDPCGHIDHGRAFGGEYHDGPGEWLVHNIGHGCKPSEHKLVCDKYKKTLIDRDPPVRCSCGKWWRPSEQYTVLGRKGVDF